MAEVTSPKAISTLGIKLLYGASKEAMSELARIKDYGDLVGNPNTIEVTDLQDGQQTFIPGILTSDNKPFTCNFTKESYKAVQQKANTPAWYALRLSDKSGWVWQGQHTCAVPGKGVDDPVEFTINVTNSSPVEFEENITATDDAP